MAFSMDFGTGFEMGSIQLVLDSERDLLTMSSAEKTGDHALYVSGWIDFSVSGSPSDLYLALWVDPDDAWNENNYARIYFYLDAGYLYLALGNTHWDLYHSDDGQIATGTVVINDDYHHLQAHLSIGDSGTFETKVDGIDDISFSGDTKPSTATYVDYIKVQSTDGDWRFDDFCFGTGGWPGDIRFEALVPNADTATIDWTGSDADQTDNYALVDEAGPSAADYVESVLNGDQDKYDLEDFVATNKDPLAVVLWAYAKKDEADAHQIKLILDDGTEDIGAAQDLLTSYTYLHRLDLTKPSGGDWTDAALDALEAGVESVIV